MKRRNIIMLLLGFSLFCLTACQEKSEYAHDPASEGRLGLVGDPGGAVNARDMVCGDAPPFQSYQSKDGKKYGFCNDNCRQKFKDKPSLYLK